MRAPAPVPARCIDHPDAGTGIYWGMEFVGGVMTEVGLRCCDVCFVPVTDERTVGGPVRA